MSNRDWTGGRASVYKTLGASNHTADERETNDYYATDPSAIDKLLSKVQLPHVILEPACGEGHLSKRLIEFGHEVHSYDLVDRGYGETQNFFELLTAPIDGEFAIVTNPPYAYAMEFILHALQIIPNNGLICMFVKTTFLEGKRRYEQLFKNTPPFACCSFQKGSYARKTGILKV